MSSQPTLKVLTREPAGRNLGTKETAKVIREALKRERGWGPRQVSVRLSRFSMGSSVDLEIKSPDIPEAVVEAIALQYQDTGRNFFVSVTYGHDVLRPLAEAIEADLEAVTTSETPERLLGIFDLSGSGRSWRVDRAGEFVAESNNDPMEYLAWRVARYVAHHGILSGEEV